MGGVTIITGSEEPVSGSDDATGTSRLELPSELEPGIEFFDGSENFKNH
jgi:hypothetical protein